MDVSKGGREGQGGEGLGCPRSHRAGGPINPWRERPGARATAAGKRGAQRRLRAKARLLRAPGFNVVADTLAGVRDGRRFHTEPDAGRHARTYGGACGIAAQIGAARLRALTPPAPETGNVETWNTDRGRSAHGTCLGN